MWSPPAGTEGQVLNSRIILSRLTNQPIIHPSRARQGRAAAAGCRREREREREREGGRERGRERDDRAGPTRRLVGWVDRSAAAAISFLRSRCGEREGERAPSIFPRYLSPARGEEEAAEGR
ncbi:hypothetical protein GQ55_4G362800 [Panicum hallii var. hallii]|uniref:Uncharacterized protein n=1 Tax=Panicum hallii var. hallii TaxID=1504633 RepID=A0A2T7E3T2_9POAL|nr:hypothetical protein GQ55_4G362800 [Panicum hallii var. hallii]